MVKEESLEPEVPPVRLHLACGDIVLPNWLNLDYEARIPGIVQADLTHGIPFKNETVDEIFCSHFLEHLKLRHEAIPFLQECYRVLKPGGIMSFITPNFRDICRKYWHRGIRQTASATFGDGRSPWDYHVSAWWPDRFVQLVLDGYIDTPGGVWKVWDGVELVRVSTLGRAHSAYEVTAIFRKQGGTAKTYPTWLGFKEIVGEGLIPSWEWHFKLFGHRASTAISKALKRVRSAIG